MVLLEERVRRSAPQRTDDETIDPIAAPPVSSEDDTMAKNAAMLVEADRAARHSLIPVVASYLTDLLETEDVSLGQQCKLVFCFIEIYGFKNDTGIDCPSIFLRLLSPVLTCFRNRLETLP